MAASTAIETIIEIVYKDSIDEWENADGRFGRITYDRFSSILLDHDICTDSRTIRAKWNIIVAKGIFRPYGKRTNLAAHVDLETLDAKYPYLKFLPVPEKSNAFITKPMNTHAHTHTNQEADQ